MLDGYGAHGRHRHSLWSRRNRGCIARIVTRFGCRLRSQHAVVERAALEATDDPGHVGIVVATHFCRLGFRRGRKVGSGLIRLLGQMAVALYLYPVALDGVVACN